MHHHHHHTHTSRDGNHALALAFFLNLVFTGIEFIGAWWTNSTAIFADAVHDLGDCLAIGTAWGLAVLSTRHANAQFSYGLRRLSLLGALMNAVVLILGSFWVLMEAVPRLSDPEMPMAEGMMLLAVFGIVVNGYAAYRLSGSHKQNERVLNWHLLEDVLGWVAVLIVSAVLLFADLPILDPILSIVFTLFILVNVLRHLWRTVKLFLQASPDIELHEKIQRQICALNPVENLHHVHFWSLDGENHVLTMHVVVRDSMDVDEQKRLKESIADILSPYPLSHTTIELEFSDEACRDSRTV